MSWEQCSGATHGYSSWISTDLDFLTDLIAALAHTYEKGYLIALPASWTPIRSSYPY